MIHPPFEHLLYEKIWLISIQIGPGAPSRTRER